MTMFFHWPQITWLVITGLLLLLRFTGMRTAGKRAEFWFQLAGALLMAWLLWCGGFFSQAHAAEPPPAALKYRSDVIRSARVDWGLNAPVADFAAQLHQESGWNPAARSPVGAQGLAQFMPSTADWIAGLMPHLATREPYNPGWAIRALVSYDRWLWQRVAVPDGCERMAMTLSAYNGGLGWVNRDRRLARMRGLDDARWFGSVEMVNAGRSTANWRENRRYPQRILRELAPRYLSWGGSNCVG
ncbi:lytic transglycosylase domain-containing protein [Salmonella enterica subsp. enterica serovar Montevideo]|nr:lytic transglycosylase domain-containing protein [Salmonella enterica]ECH4008129.1 lytic transglycosylase domain-containing protein [Salmonella enterica subsp. enterica serovar Montevideo]EBM1330938.1 lytic transglycosylase domain-containing protein [Salmonella enterica]ECT8738531.1 lytic transglycosylase domain-containing protein [Salmonella enterica subsp. enterica serovar Montevideo]EDH6962577.1 lytic transglycosylase domain-containing protein [Salmonella enterica subsp. enterica serovar 